MKMKEYIAVMYLRLSDDDREKNGLYSESIENQEMICRQWLSYHPEIKLYGVFIDDGKTGLNYNRDGFQEMKAVLDAGLANMIICKALMRFGREEIDTLIYFKREFVQKNIRFVAVADGIDYLGPESDRNMDLSFKIMVNDYSSKQTSINVRSVQEAKRGQGLFIGSYAAYGYIKDPQNKNRLVIDPPAAQVVRRIYDLFLQGYNVRAIAGVLNNEGVLCPSDYKRQVLQYNYRNSKALKTTHYWTYCTVKRILQHEVYIGSIVQHTTEKIAYNLETVRAVPREQWCVRKDKHEPIISPEDFEKVQQLIAVRYREPDFKHLSIYAGYLKCGDCGRAMSKQKIDNGYKYRCGTYARVGKKYCSSHIITSKELDKMLLKEINKIITAITSEDVDYVKKSLSFKNMGGDMDAIKGLYKRQESMVEEKKEMLRLVSKKVVDETDFLLYNENYQKEYAALEQQISRLKLSVEESRKYYRECEEWIENFLKYKNIKQVTRELIVSLVKEINVFENQKIQIKFLFKNPFGD